MSESMSGRAAAQQAATKVLREEVGLAGRRGEERIRRRVLAIPSSNRYLHSEGHASFEVLDASAVEVAILAPAVIAVDDLIAQSGRQAGASRDDKTFRPTAAEPVDRGDVVLGDRVHQRLTTPLVGLGRSPVGLID